MTALSSCLESKDTSSADVIVPVVVDYNMSYGSYLSAFYYGPVVPDNINVLNDYATGDCAIAKITIDLNKQNPSAYYITGSNVMLEKIETTTPHYDLQPDDTAGYSFPALSVDFFSMSFSPYYLGKFFVSVSDSIASKQAVEYDLTYKQMPDEDGIFDFYLKGKVIGISGKKEYITQYHAFDFTDIIMAAGKDTVITYGQEQEQRWRYLKFRLKYFGGTGDDLQFRNVGVGIDTIACNLDN
jgi:hypothetical protein